MKPLIVIGATGPYCPPGVADLIRENLRPVLLRAAAGEKHYSGTFTVFYEQDSRGALDLLDQLPDAVVAYAPGVFGPAITRQPVRLHTGGTQCVLTTNGDIEKWRETDDPRQHIEGVRAVLRAPVVNVQNSAALRWLSSALIGKVVAA